MIKYELFLGTKGKLPIEDLLVTICTLILLNLLLNSDGVTDVCKSVGGSEISCEKALRWPDFCSAGTHACYNPILYLYPAEPGNVSKFFNFNQILTNSVCVRSSPLRYQPLKYTVLDNIFMSVTPLLHN